MVASLFKMSPTYSTMANLLVAVSAVRCQWSGHLQHRRQVAAAQEVPMVWQSETFCDGPTMQSHAAYAALPCRLRSPCNSPAYG